MSCGLNLGYCCVLAGWFALWVVFVVVWLLRVCFVVGF